MIEEVDREDHQGRKDHRKMVREIIMISEDLRHKEDFKTGLHKVEEVQKEMVLDQGSKHLLVCISLKFWQAQSLICSRTRT